MFGLFRRYARRYVTRHIHTVRLACQGYRPDGGLTGPMVVLMNHPSWWDPLIGLVLSGFWPDRTRHYAPIASAGLARYPFFERIGFFGIEPGTARGGLAFLRRSLAALAHPDTVLWVTAQGRFTDPRGRPTRLEGGIGHLARRLDTGYVLPLALEYPFWDERTPEALARFGLPIALGGPERRLSPAEWTARFERALEETQDALAGDAISRDPARFETLLAGGAGVGGWYDAWRRFQAVARGQWFVAAHGNRPES
jgi:1-acyl-sn-glycerol-3-phosphate acyltransferase